MAGFLKYLALVFSCIIVATILSYFAFFSFYFAPKIRQSVTFVRGCDTAGQVVLLPVRIIFRAFGGLVDQSLPLSHPLNYVVTNGIFLGFIIYTGVRPIVFRQRTIPAEKPPQQTNT